jgi:hypothetical protein
VTCGVKLKGTIYGIGLAKLWKFDPRSPAKNPASGEFQSRKLRILTAEGYLQTV